MILRWPGAGAILARDRRHERPASPGSRAGHGQSHAAPRTPLESPCSVRTKRVTTGPRRRRRDRPRGPPRESRDVREPAPQDDHVGVQRLITEDSARASRSDSGRGCRAPGSPSARRRDLRPAQPPRSRARGPSNPGPESHSRCIRSGRNSRRVPGFRQLRPGEWVVPPFAGDGVGPGQDSPRRRSRRPPPCRGSPRRRCARPPPAPSVASERAKQLASFARRTGRPRRPSRSDLSGRPLSQVEFAFFTRPVPARSRRGSPCRRSLSPRTRRSSRPPGRPPPRRSRGSPPWAWRSGAAPRWSHPGAGRSLRFSSRRGRCRCAWPPE